MLAMAIAIAVHSTHARAKGCRQEMYADKEVQDSASQCDTGKEGRRSVRGGVLCSYQALVSPLSHLGCGAAARSLVGSFGNSASLRPLIACLLAAKASFDFVASMGTTTISVMVDGWS